MFKKIVKIGSVAAAGYAAYKILDNQLKDAVEVIPVEAVDIIEALKDRGMNIILGYDQKIVHFISEDKDIVIQGRVNEVGEVFLIEYFNKLDMSDMLVAVYPHNTVVSGEVGENAILSFRRFLGSVGVSIDRFEILIKEIIENPKLSDLSF